MSIPTLRSIFNTCVKRYREREILKEYQILMMDIKAEDEIVDLGNGGLQLNDGEEEGSKLYDSGDDENIYIEHIINFRNRIENLILEH